MAQLCARAVVEAWTQSGFHRQLRLTDPLSSNVSGDPVSSQYTVTILWFGRHRSNTLPPGIVPMHAERIPRTEHWQCLLFCTASLLQPPLPFFPRRCLFNSQHFNFRFRSILLPVQFFCQFNSSSPKFPFHLLNSPPPPSQPLKGAANCPHLLPFPLHSKSVEDKDKDKDNKNTLTSSVLGQHKTTQKVDVSFSYYYIFWPLHYHAHIIERVNSKVQIAPTWPTMTSTPHCDGIDNYKSATQLLRPPPSSSQFSPISS